MPLPLGLALASLLELTSAREVAMEPSLRVIPEVLASALPAWSARATGKEASTTGTEKETKPAPGPWTASITLGLDWLTGNSKSLTVAGDAIVDHISSRWLLTLEADGEYVTAAVPGEASRNIAAEIGGWAHGDYRITPVFSGFLYFATEANHFASLSLRLQPQAGLGATLLERRPGAPDELVLRFYLGAAYTRDRRFQYYPTHQDVPDQDVWSPGIGVSFRASLDDHVKLLEEAFVFPAPSRVLARSQTVLRSSLTSRLALTAEFWFESNSAPAPGKAITDTTLLFGATIEL